MQPSECARALGQGRLSYAVGASTLSYEGTVSYPWPAGTGVMLSRVGRHTGPFGGGSEHGVGCGAVTNCRPAADGVVFIGPVRVNGLRNGSGTCGGATTAAPAWPCRFDEGKLYEKAK